MIKHAKSQQEFLLDSANSHTVSGIAFDGCYFYLLDSSVCKVFCYNTCFEYLEDISTNRVYSSLCYDSKQNCFWAAAKECPNLIFQLNPCFQEIKEIPICYKSRNNGAILGISCNCKTGVLLLVFTWGILEHNPCDGDTILFYETKQGKLSGVLSLAPGCLVTRFESEQQSVVVLNKCNQVIRQKIVEQGCILKQIIYDGNQGEESFYALLTLKDGCSKIIARGVSKEELGFLPDCCNETKCESCCEETKCETCIEKKGSECCQKEQCLQNITDKMLGIPLNNMPCSCQKADVLESVALTGAALAHILNAEGEKLQKVLACTDDISNIMCVNKSIQQTIIHITRLEQVILEQLAALEGICREEQCCNQQEKECCEKDCNRRNNRCCKEEFCGKMCCERMCCERLCCREKECQNRNSCREFR